MIAVRSDRQSSKTGGFPWPDGGIGLSILRIGVPSGVDRVVIDDRVAVRSPRTLDLCVGQLFDA